MTSEQCCAHLASLGQPTQAVPAKGSKASLQMNPYDDPAVSAGEIAEYLYFPNPQPMPHFPTTLKESAAKYPGHATNLELAAGCAEATMTENDYPVWERGFIARLVGDGSLKSMLSSPYQAKPLQNIWQQGWMMADDVLEESATT